MAEKASGVLFPGLIDQKLCDPVLTGCSTVMEEVRQCRMATATCWELSVPKTDLAEVSVRLWLLEVEADEVEWLHKEMVCCPQGPHGCSSSQKSL